MDKKIVLIGFMGSGKTAVGKVLATRLGWSFLDTDNEIERLTGMKVAEIFRRQGERRFRSEERLLAAKLAGRSRVVVATGGGMVLDEESTRSLKQGGFLVWLRVSPETIMNRVGRRAADRPLLRRRATREEIAEMLRQREAYYEKAADLIVEADNKGLDDVVREIITGWQQASKEDATSGQG